MSDVYALEDVRTFIVRRPWFRDGHAGLVSESEYDDLKARTLTLPEERAAYLRAFRDGWMRAKE